MSRHNSPLPLLLTLSLVLVITYTLARPAAAAERCLSGNCANGYGTYEFTDGEKYTGYWKNDKRNGQGINTWPNGIKYVGEFLDGKKNGQGTHTWPDGKKYVGQWQDGMTSGQGTLTFPSGEKYIGEFRDGRFDGQGTLTGLKGAKYIGGFKEGKPHGRGSMFFADGGKYTGEIKDGKISGQGTLLWPDGRKFVGQWQDGNRSIGTTTYADGRILSGQWADPKPIYELTSQEFAAILPAGTQQVPPERPNTPAPKLRRVALVIGNSAYATAPLKNPVNDARDMATTLKSLGFEVILRENASLAQMEDAVDEFWGQLKRGGAGLFYFAGHGLQVNGKNYLVPVDARLTAEQDARYKCMDAGLVLGRMENAGNGLNLVILDACRNNPFARSWRSAEQGLAKMDAPRGSIIAYATAPDSIAADGQGRNGIYTEKLLQAIRAPGQPVELVFKRVRDEVMRATGDKQVPWESTSLRGDFYFTSP